MIRRFATFTVVGGLGFLVDAGGTWMLIDRAGASAVVARPPALVLAMVTTWWLNRTLTFEVQRRRSGGEFARYMAVAVATALLNYACYLLLLSIGLRPVLSVAIATIVLMLGSFHAYRRMVFS